MARLAVVIWPGDGERLTARGSKLSFKALAANTSDAFTPHQRPVPACGRRPPPHRHPDYVEAYWVLDGEAESELDGQVTLAAASARSCWCPAAATHTFGATQSMDLRLLALHAPAPDDYFRELRQLSLRRSATYA